MGATSPRGDPETRWETAAAVLRALHGESRMHVTDLGEALEADPAVVDQACFELQRDGYVRARAGGDFSITALGEQRLRNLRHENH